MDVSLYAVADAVCESQLALHGQGLSVQRR